MNNEIIKTEKTEILGSPFMPQGFQGKLQLADILVKSKLCPKALDTKEKVFVALQYGHELGLSPMVAIQNIAVVNGRPTIMTDIMGAIAFKANKLEEYKIEKVPDDKGDIVKIIVTGKRKDNGFSFEGTFSIDDAIKADLLFINEKKILTSTKDNWRKYPIRMLEHRAKSIFFKAAFPEMLAGFLTPEEAESIEPITDVTEPLPEDTKKDSSRLKNLIDKEEKTDIVVNTLDYNDSKSAQEELDQEVAKEKLDKKVEKLDKELDEVIKEEPKKEEKPKAEPKKKELFEAPESKSNYNPVDAWLDIFANDRCRNLREFMTEKDITYFTNLARCTDKAIYTENNYKRDLEKVKKYEKEMEAKNAN